MVRRLVEKQNVGLPVHKLAEADLRLLTTGEDADLALDILCSQAALCKSRADFVLGVGRKLLPDLPGSHRHYTGYIGSQPSDLSLPPVRLRRVRDSLLPHR